MLNIARFVFNPFRENTYVAWDETLEGIVVDPGNNYPKEHDALFNFIDNQNIKLRAVVATHGHYDHVCGAGALKQRYGVPFALCSTDEYVYSTSAFDGNRYQFIFEQVPYEIDLASGQPLKFGNTILKVLPTPGHTLGGVSLYSEAAKVIFTGDTIMCGTVGRTDLKGGDWPTLHQSIVREIMPLPDEVEIYPGHGPQSTVGHERTDNPFLQ